MSLVWKWLFIGRTGNGQNQKLWFVRRPMATHRHPQRTSAATLVLSPKTAVGGDVPIAARVVTDGIVERIDLASKTFKTSYYMTKDETISTIEIRVTEDGATHTRLSCGKGRSFLEVLEGVKISEAEIQRLIKDLHLCPFSPSHVSLRSNVGPVEN